MSLPTKKDAGSQWVTTLSWPDKVIARCFPRFFERYAPEEIKEQWVNYLGKKHGRGKAAPGETDLDAQAGTKSDPGETKEDNEPR